MKFASLLTTLILQFLMMVVLKLLDNLFFIIGLLLVCVIVGLVIRFSSKYEENEDVQNLNWGFMYGSLTTLILTVSFVLWLSNNYPR